MKLFVIALLLLPLWVQAETAPLRSNDFAYGMTLEGDGEGAIYAFDLPAEVYRHVVRADLGDLRIFNGNGEVVPHLLQHATAGEEVDQTVMLPFFPLYADEVGAKGETTLRIVPGQQGAVIDLRAQTAKEAGVRTISHYIIDASALQQPISRLVLHWSAGDETFINTVTLEHANDLDRWQPLASGSLAELLYGSDRLQRNVLTLPANQLDYLRVSWPMGAKGVSLASVEAVVSQPGAPAALNWSPALSRASDGVSGRYEFEVTGHYPVEHLRVELPQDNTVVKVSVSSSDAPAAKWTPRYQGVLYSLRHEGQRIESGELDIATNSDRFWRLEVAQEGGGIGAGAPQLELGWHPHRVLFVARGSAPFTVAFGSARVVPPLQDTGLAGWLANQPSDGAGTVAIKTIVPQAVHTLGGDAQLKPPPPPLPWKTWLLWAVLLSGVVAMLGMARALYRQMSRTS